MARMSNDDAMKMLLKDKEYVLAQINADLRDRIAELEAALQKIAANDGRRSNEYCEHIARKALEKGNG